MALLLQRRRFLQLAAMAAGGVVLAPPVRCGTAPTPAKQAPVLRARDGLLQGELRAGTSAGWLPGGPGRILTYNGHSPGPRLELNPGDSVRLRLINGLGEPTNLHFHGLHVSPGGHADNIFLSIPPGESLTYSFEIPKNHPGGTFYYHPHRHGTTADQVFAGLGGVITVRGALDAIPAIQQAREEFLFLKDFPSAAQGSLPFPMARRLGREGSLQTVNGTLQPDLRVAGGGLLRLRIVNGSNARFYRLALEDHPLYLIATDGGGISAPLALEELLLAPGERAEVLVQANRGGGRYRLLNLPYNRFEGMGMGMGMGRMGRGPQGFGRSLQDDGPTTLATISYENEAAPVPLPAQLVPVPPLSGPLQNRTFTLGHAMGPGAGMGMGMGMSFLINGRAFAPDRVDTRVRLETTEDWILQNIGVMDHPFHVHVNPFQVLSRNGRAETLRAWRDTVLVRAGEEVRIRIAFRDFPGRTVYHCHILDHEELGMMGVLEIEA